MKQALTHEIHHHGARKDQDGGEEMGEDQQEEVGLEEGDEEAQSKTHGDEPPQVIEREGQRCGESAPGA
jgi:hypothetical protein